MQPSLRSLLTQIIDYAGLFPPAQLKLDQALATYARARQEDDAWMLGRFVLPATRLEELRPFLQKHFGSGPPLEVAVLGRGGNSGGEFLENLALDLEAVATARAMYDERVRVTVLETRLPIDRSLNALLRESAEQAYQSQLLPFFEIPVTREYPEALVMALQGCMSSGRAGLKLRCGGVEKTAFPTVETVGQFITECVVARVPMKFTAGLHHPLRKYDAGVKTQMHGFINVFMAAVLAVEHRLAQPTLCDLLRDEDPRYFHWDPEQIGWREYRVHNSEVELARRFAAISFGSCSFDEPRADLRALKWM